MKNFKKLSRADLKKVSGKGLACTYSIQDRNGNWTLFQANADHGQAVNMHIVTLVLAVVHYA